MRDRLRDHQKELVVNRGAPSAVPVNSPGVAIDPEPSPLPPWWMYMGGEGLSAAKFADNYLVTLVGSSTAPDDTEPTVPEGTEEELRAVTVEDEVEDGGGGGWFSIRTREEALENRRSRMRKRS